MHDAIMRTSVCCLCVKKEEDERKHDFCVQSTHGAEHIIENVSCFVIGSDIDPAMRRSSGIGGRDIRNINMR